MAHTYKSLDYVPIGTTYTPEEMYKVPPTFLENRSLFDLRYAGLDANFDWRDYVTVDVQDLTLKAQVIETLEQFSKTRNGQHLLRQSLAMQTFRDTGIVPSKGELPGCRSHAIVITDMALHENKREDYNGITKFDIIGGNILLNDTQINSIEIRQEDGEYKNATIQAVLSHELGHGADGFMHQGNYDTLNVMYASGKPYNDRGKDLAETAAIRAENGMMVVHYGEMPSVSDYATRKRPDPDPDYASQSHFHSTLFVATVEDMGLPPLPTPRAASKTGNEL